MLLQRQKCLPASVGCLLGKVENLGLQKLWFLDGRGAESVACYDLVPYRFGGEAEQTSTNRAITAALYGRQTQ